MRYLLDTNAVSDLIADPAGGVGRRCAELGAAALATSTVVMAELRFGALRRNAPRLTARVSDILRLLPVLALGPREAEAYAEIRLARERVGAPTSDNDLWIAAQARAAGLILITDNSRDFDRIDGLRVENWRRDAKPTEG